MACFQVSYAGLVRLQQIPAMDGLRRIGIGTIQARLNCYVTPPGLYDFEEIAMKIAIIAEWLSTYAGSERVLEQIIACYPDADLFAVMDFVPTAERGFLAGKQPVVSFIQNLPFAKQHYRLYLSLMTFAIEQFDLSGYDLILSNSHAVAKGVMVGPDQLHISYINSPMRYAWDLQHQYLAESGLNQHWFGWIARYLLHRLRSWDVRTTLGVDIMLANSNFIRRRIRRVYGRDATVIYPPVDVEKFTLHPSKENFYLTASRMVPYKRVDLIVQAFAGMPDRHLVVIGEGPDFRKIRKLAGSNVEFLGYQPDAVLRDYMQRAKAFVFAAEEDFGIVPVEAQACGTPVIAYGKGGSLETVTGPDDPDRPPTGVFFREQRTESLIAAVRAFEADLSRFDPAAIRRHAENFSSNRFRTEFKRFVEQAITDWRNRL